MNSNHLLCQVFATLVLLVGHEIFASDLEYDHSGNLRGILSESSIQSWSHGVNSPSGNAVDVSSPVAVGIRSEGGYSVLEAYAYNINPAAPGNGVLNMLPNGISGLPLITALEADEGFRLHAEHLRHRRALDLTYRVEFSDLLNGWSSATDTGSVSIINDDWERVVVQDSVTSATHAERFARVLVEYTPPTAPVPSLPVTADGIHVATLAPTIAWQGSGSPSEYEFQLAADFTDNVLDSHSGTVTNPFVSIAPSAPLEGGATYYWRSRVVDETWSTWKSFNTPPSAAVLSAPKDVQTADLRPTFTWEALPTAVGYEWQLGNGHAHGQTVLRTETPTAASYSLPAGQNLEPSQSYVWRVRARNAQEVYGAWSAWAAFTTQIALVSPQNGGVQLPSDLTFSWDPIAGFAHLLQVNSAANFQGTTYGVGNIPAEGGNFQFSSDYQTQPLPQGANFYWRVGILTSTGMRWSEIRNGQTMNVSSHTPHLEFPANGASEVSRTPNLSWTDVAGATSYRVQVSEGEDFATTRVDQTITASNYQVPNVNGEQLQRETFYYWRAQAEGLPWSDIWTFTTRNEPPGNAPALISPAHEAEDRAVRTTFEWTALPNATVYKLRIIQVSDPNIVRDYDVTTGTTFQIPVDAPLPYNRQHDWRVLAGNSAGWSGVSVEGGNWSETWRFHTRTDPTLDVPTLQYPANGATNVSRTPNLNWTDVAGVTNYRVQVSEAEDFATTRLDQTTTTSSYQVPDVAGQRLQRETFYYWRARAVGQPWSEASSFITQNEAPDIAPSLISPTNGAENRAVSTTFEWSPLLNATVYKLRIIQVSDPNNVRDYDVSGTTFQIPADSPLPYNRQHDWRVLAGNSAGWSGGSVEGGNWSETWRFRTKLAEVEIAPQATSPASGATNVSVAPRFQWTAAPNAAGYEGSLYVEDNPGDPPRLLPERAWTTNGELSHQSSTNANDWLRSNRRYFYRVRGTNTGGDAGPWSPLIAFVTEGRVQGTPTLVSPVDGAVDRLRRPNLRWRPLPNATKYDVHVVRDDGANPRNYTDVVPTVINADIVQFQLPDMLGANRKFRWRVRGKNDLPDTPLSNAGSWSNVWEFTTGE